MGVGQALMRSAVIVVFTDRRACDYAIDLRRYVTYMFAMWRLPAHSNGQVAR
jgi:hypothetical protein